MSFRLILKLTSFSWNCLDLAYTIYVSKYFVDWMIVTNAGLGEGPWCAPVQEIS